jgi:hypothetical protein
VVRKYGEFWEVYDLLHLTDDPYPAEPLLMDSCRTREQAIDSALDLFRHWLRRPENLERFRTGLAGAKYLACWCATGRPCHVDVILEEVFGDG